MRLRLLLPTAGVLTVLTGAQAFAAPVVVACGPGQHAVVRDTFIRGESVTRVECVGNAYYGTAYREPYATRYRVQRRHRSWGKSALVIGGSAGTGAGIGGILAGKKGALIGAALGGGAGSLYESAHRR
jgi:hypothetical protein